MTMTKNKALQYVVMNPSGNIQDLYNKIGEDYVKEFEYMGYIRNGVSSTAKTYKSTESASRDYKAFYQDTPLFAAIPSIVFGFISKLFA